MNDIKVVQNSKTKNISNIDQWTTAFLKFVAIYCSKFLHEASSLMKYGETVRRLAAGTQSMVWATHNTQFWLFRERHHLPRDQIHMEFWLMATTLHPSLSITQSPSQQNRSNKPFKNKDLQNWQQPFLANTCWTYNKKGECRFSRCRHPFLANTCWTYNKKGECQFPRCRQLFLANTCWTYNKKGECRFPRCRYPHTCGLCRGNHHAGSCTSTRNQSSSQAIAKLCCT